MTDRCHVSCYMIKLKELVPVISTERIEQIMSSGSTVYIAVLDEAGSPTVSAISSLRHAGVHTAWFATGLRSTKVQRLRRDNRASLCYCDGKNNITLVGTVQVLTDQASKDDLWLDWFIAHFPGGKTDPDYCILQFTAERVSAWVDSNTLLLNLAEV